MRVYDFDKTIFHYDSTERFIVFCLLRHPAFLRFVPAMLPAWIRLSRGKIGKERFKEICLRFVPLLADPAAEVERFWNRNLKHIHAWYVAQAGPDDIVVSASPAFIVAPACKRLTGCTVIASPYDPVSGKFTGPNCHGEEKVRRLRAQFPDAVVEEFYSDSHNDNPLAALAEKAFRVRGERLRPW